MGKFEDLSGQKFGRLTVIEIYGRDKFGKILYRCRCDCGGDRITHGRSLKSGHCQSCGCLNTEAKIANSKYGGLAQSEKRLYQICTLSKKVGRPEWGAELGKRYFVLTILSVKEE